MSDSYLMDRENPARAPASRELVPPLVARWHGPAWSTLVENGRLVLQHHNHRILALDEGTQALKWTIDRQGSVQLISDRRLFVDVASNETHVFEMESGDIISIIHGPPLSHPLVVNEIFFGPFWDGEHQCEGSLAVDLRAGRRVWTKRRPDARYDSRNGATFCANDRLAFFALGDGTLVARSIADGEQVWHLDYHTLTTYQGKPSPVRFTPTLQQDCLIVEHGFSIALAPDTGEILWRHESGICEGNYPYQGRIYQVFRGGKYRVRDVRTGQVLLDLSLNETVPDNVRRAGISGPLAVSETHAFVAAGSEYVVALERDTGAFAWSSRCQNAGGFCDFVIVNRRLYAKALRGLYCFEEKRGASA